MITAEDLTQAQHWNAWVSLATAVTCLAFIVAYTVLARWWTSYEGRVMVGKAIALMLLAGYTFFVLKFAPESEPARWVRVGLIGTIGMFMVFQTVRLFTNQLNRDKDRRNA